MRLRKTGCKIATTELQNGVQRAWQHALIKDVHTSERFSLDTFTSFIFRWMCPDYSIYSPLRKTQLTYCRRVVHGLKAVKLCIKGCCCNPHQPANPFELCHKYRNKNIDSVDISARQKNVVVRSSQMTDSKSWAGSVTEFFVSYTLKPLKFQPCNILMQGNIKFLIGSNMRISKKCLALIHNSFFRRH